MSLVPSGVILSYFSNGQIVNWSLNVEQMDTTATRTVSVIPLPSPQLNPTAQGNPFNNRPIAWALDLGMIEESIVLRGTTKDNDTDESTPTVAEMDEIVRCVSVGLSTHIVTTSGPSGTIQTLGADQGVYISINLGEGQGSGTGSRMNTVQQPLYHGSISTFTKHKNFGETWWTWVLTLSVVDWSQDNFVNGVEQ